MVMLMSCNPVSIKLSEVELNLAMLGNLTAGEESCPSLVFYFLCFQLFPYFYFICYTGQMHYMLVMILIVIIYCSFVSRFLAFFIPEI